MVVVDLTAVLLIVDGFLVGRLIGLMLDYYDVPQRVLEAAYRLHDWIWPPPPLVPTPDMERAAWEMARMAASFGVTREEILQFSRRMAALSQRTV